MDRDMQLRHLAEAERHVTLGARHVSDQEQRVADLELYGCDTTLARAILQTFVITQAQHIAHRDQILRELAE